jgi:penicillin-insensitive murein endopeptidase
LVVPKPDRFALTALVLVALNSLAASALAAPRSSHGRARPGRRAALEVPSARASRGSTGAAPKLEKPPAAKPEKADSIGSPNEGHLEGGVHLDVSKPYFRVVPMYTSGDVRWGLPTMMSLIDRAARAVNKRYPGSALDVGDISQKGGGDVLRHHSHESGRDADLGFYAVDAKGKQVHHHGFIKFDAGLDSVAVPGAHFDLPRNWLLVEQMLTDPIARVSHIFIAEPLRQKLLAYARTRGVSRALLDRAQIVLMQPTASLPHDDHFHVRISCPATMRGTCIELAKNLPHGKNRIARHGHAPLHTPGKGTLAHGAAPGHTKGGGGAKHPPAAAGMAPTDPFSDVGTEADDSEGDADAAEVKDAVDETGTLRITD